MYIFCEKDLERYQLKSNFFLLSSSSSSKDHTIEMGEILYSELDLDRVFNMQRKKVE
jgi:hypothetical protein